MQSLKGGYAIVKNEKIRKYLKDVLNTMSIHINEFALSCTEIVYSR